MQLGLHANVCDSATAHIVSALHKPFAALSAALSGEYGGPMEHLWIDLELVEHIARPVGKAKFPFRFQKRVSGRSHFGLPPTPDNFNVGHYSVRPDFQLLASMSAEQAVPYVLALIYESVKQLSKKQLGGFDVALFRNNFRNECTRLGYEVACDTF
ncbi:hypothetical protein [Undibacterium rugosum]|uniref:Uncharacterized protein n=1 Tax=Undibacterium rugosum TaxID=2762291 RepID=A0A923L052_9BURK|nr:hypothetical protein [Undibacterium rugosum]MBC3937233.1 hypothetical protein [Undibacterium rugosum]MBR7780418.1 hypothetical protein [Undibacterium rugosum]